mgnify:CR=1 FL=1
MKPWKKILSTIMTFILAFTFVGCSGGEKANAVPSSAASEASQESKEASKEKKIGIAMPEKTLQRWVQDGSNMKKVLEDKGYSCELQYANNDVNLQAQQCENMITNGLLQRSNPTMNLIRNSSIQTLM